jgi:hypothetical protein
MNRILLLVLSAVLSCNSLFAQINPEDQKLAHIILDDHSLDTVQARASKLLSGFSAGRNYDELRIRDFNTFIKGSLKVHPKQEVKEKLLLFLKFQNTDGSMVDGIVDSAKAKAGDDYRYSSFAPGWAAFKNTAATDQESSLVQAVRKYVDATGDAAFLDEKVGTLTVTQRMEAAMAYVLKERWASKLGLVMGATTIDWGDVQPEVGAGTVINPKTKWAVDIYDNAMFVIAINDFLAIKPSKYNPARDWASVAVMIRRNVRDVLWNSRLQKYTPHVYLNGSPFSGRANEENMLYPGGSICAILAGFTTRKEVFEINRQLLAAAAHEKYATIGLSVYPPYPQKDFPTMPPYQYQNGGDYAWFGGRMIEALLRYDFDREAYTELLPFVKRSIAHNGFFEWYDVQTGEPKGLADFRGEAGVLYDAITLLRQWAVNNR